MTDESSQAWTVLRLLEWTREHLRNHEVDSPRLAAEILLAHCLHCARIELYTRFDHCPSDQQLTDYRQLVKRAADHEPIAYLVGEKEFYSLRFKVTPDVLVPRPETELLVAAAVEHLRTLKRPGAVWDVCTGSGCVGIAIASQVEGTWVLATDISARAITVAQQNVKVHNLTDRVVCCVADLLNLPRLPGDRNEFDVITANPPYVGEGDEVAQEVTHEPPIALYAAANGLEFVDRIVRTSPHFLVTGGILAIEFGYGHGDAVRDSIVAEGHFEEPRILKDHQGIERAAVAKRGPG